MLISILSGIITRLIYHRRNPDAFSGNPLNQDLDLDFAFTGVDFIREWIFLISFYFILWYLLPLLSTDLAGPYLKEILTKWLFSYALFLFFYYGFNTIQQTQGTNFDPSGTIAAALVSQAQHSSFYIFTQRDNVNQTTLAPMSLLFFFLFQIHACYMVFFTAFIFHSVGESMTGYLFGLVISGEVYDRDWILESIQYLMNPSSTSRKQF